MPQNVNVCDDCNKQIEKVELVVKEKDNKPLIFCNRKCLGSWCNKGTSLFGG